MGMKQLIKDTPAEISKAELDSTASGLVLFHFKSAAGMAVRAGISVDSGLQITRLLWPADQGDAARKEAQALVDRHAVWFSEQLTRAKALRAGQG